MMKKAYNTLKKMKCPVFWDAGEDYFRISAEHNFDPEYGDQLWADCYEAEGIEGYDYGISPKIHKVIKKNDLYIDWINAGEIGVYES